jgi:4'-phosphopantetheinyl transferase
MSMQSTIWYLELCRENLRQHAVMFFSTDHIMQSGMECQSADVLHAVETAKFNSFQSQKRKGDFLLGRYCAKKALQALESQLTLQEIHIDAGVFNQPVIKNPKSHYQVSISHTQSSAVALVFPEEQPMGVDVEMLSAESKAVLTGQFTDQENQLVLAYRDHIQDIVTLLWTAKESLSKILKTGLTLALHLLEVKTFEKKEDYYVVTFTYFNQYKSILITHNDVCLGISMPRCTQLFLTPTIKQLSYE